MVTPVYLARRDCGTRSAIAKQQVSTISRHVRRSVSQPVQKGLVLPPQLREDLLAILKTKGYRELAEPIKLASGSWSCDFIDGKMALSEWRDLLTASQAIVETVKEAGHSFDAVGGLTMGADALAVGVAAVTNSRWFFVRKEPKKRGTNQLIEGAQIGPGDTVLLVDDVVTTGGSIFRALDAITRTGAETVAAVTLVDRSDIACHKFQERRIAYYPMATYQSFGIDPVEPMAAAAG